MVVLSRGIVVVGARRHVGAVENVRGNSVCFHIDGVLVEIDRGNCVAWIRVSDSAADVVISRSVRICVVGREGSGYNRRMVEINGVLSCRI